MKRQTSRIEKSTSPVKFYGYLLLLLAAFGLIWLAVYYFIEQPGPGWRLPAEQQQRMPPDDGH